MSDMIRWLRRRRAERLTRLYWANGWGPFKTPEERDKMLETLGEITDRNRSLHERGGDDGGTGEAGPAH